MKYLLGVCIYCYINGVICVEYEGIQSVRICQCLYSTVWNSCCYLQALEVIKGLYWLGF